MEYKGNANLNVSYSAELGRYIIVPVAQFHGLTASYSLSVVEKMVKIGFKFSKSVGSGQEV